MSDVSCDLFLRDGAIAPGLAVTKTVMFISDEGKAKKAVKSNDISVARCFTMGAREESGLYNFSSVSRR